MRVGEVAARAGVNVETLRYYERRGLLPAPRREPSGHRRYDEDTVRLLLAIKEAQSVGFTLAEIAEFLQTGRRSRSPTEALRVRMAAKIDEIDARVAGLRRMREQLARVIGCACESLDHCTCGAAYLARGGRTSGGRPSPLHVTNGESAGNTLRATTLGGSVLAWQDVLHEGPVRDVGRAELLRERAAFLSACGWGTRSAILASLERRDRQVLAADDVVLWFEHDLYDQLQLVDALALLHEAGRPLPLLIVVGTFLGPLHAHELEALWPQRVAATPDAAAAAAAVWAALRAPDPVLLAEWPGHPELPFVRPALLRLLEELPSVSDGLSGTERRALEAVADGATNAPAAFVASQRSEEAAFLGDAWFYRTLAELGRGRRRLVETSEGGPLPPPPPLGDGAVFNRAGLRLTAAGERVLSGDADRVELLGVDRWVGGTHVTNAELWRWDGRLVRG